MNRDKIIAYLAGLIDGEGSFTIQISIRTTKKGTQYINLNPRIGMSIMYGVEVLEELQSTFGGQIYKFKDGVQRWNLSKNEPLINTVEELLPYLRIKKKIAERFLETIKIRTRDKESILKIAEVALTLNKLNSKRNHKRMNSLQEIKEFVSR